tara:strand:- start:61 stop:666 length:606 start_codon:yes stop_codon:yes gene_type:complete
MNRKEKLALFLGMLSGDGCLSKAYNGEGYRDYPIEFWNTDKELVVLFEKLFFEIYGIHGKISVRNRPDRKPIWAFLKYSRKICEELKDLGFPEGVKRDVLRVPEVIKGGSEKEKSSFILGVMLTDGGLKKNGSLLFHMGSKRFLEDLSELIYELTGSKRKVREFTQRRIFKSYQLYLNKQERLRLMSYVPTWDNGTPLVLS